MVNYRYNDFRAIDCSIEPDLSTLKNKSVLVTGGSSGLGAAYVKAFLDAGAFITNADIQPSKEHEGDKNYQHVKCDVTSWDDQRSAFKAAVERSPEKSLDIVVANAGISGADSVLRLEDTDEPTKPDLQIMDIDLTGVIYTVKLAMHYFNKQDPSRDKSLILKSSMAGYVDLPGATLYQVSKFGVRGLFCNLRRASRMRVNLLAPWYIQTPIMSDAVVAALDAGLKKMGSSWATADDAARACIRCAADEKVHGRALAVVPREMDKNGYLDLAYDDYADRPDLAALQNMVNSSDARSVPEH